MLNVFIAEPAMGSKACGFDEFLDIVDSINLIDGINVWHTLDMPDGLDLKLEMKTSLLLMVSMCDALFLLDDWEHSKAARLERQVAKGLGMPIFRSISEMEVWMRKQEEKQ